MTVLPPAAEVADRATSTVATSAPGERPRRRSARTVFLTAVAVVVSLAFVLPALWILIGSFRPNLEILSSWSPLSWRVVIPSKLTLENYTHLLIDSGFA